MNNTIGIIAEYNPFHNGHAYQLKKIRKCHPNATIVAVMSGSFTQRGEAAILDKWARAKLAIENGVDLVCELPYAFACRSAEHFARGGVQSLAALSIDALAFGAETNDLAMLQSVAHCMDTESFQSALHDRIAAGASYASALSSELMERRNIDDSILRAPNNILAIEYLRALARYASDVTPLLIERTGAAYHDTQLHEDTASASAIRSALRGKPDWNKLRLVMPPATFDALQNANPKNLPQQDLLLRPLLARLLTMNAGELQRITGINEGLEHRLLERCSSPLPSRNDSKDSWEHLTQAIATSRYPKSRISRLLVHILANFTNDIATTCDATGPRYLRVLAMNARGTALLHGVKKTARLPIITKTSQFLNSRDCLRPLDELSALQQMLLFDVRATELRNLALPAPMATSQDFLTSPCYVKQ